MNRSIGLSLLVLTVAFIVPVTAFAGGMMDSRVVLGGDFTLFSGEVLDGDLVVMGGRATLERESVVEGDVFLLGGTVEIGGEVEGDVALFGGRIDLGSTGVIRGDVVSFGGDITREEGAIIEGDITSERGFVFPFGLRVPAVRMIQPFGSVRYDPASLLLRAVWFVLRSLLLAALAVLVVMFGPNPTTRTAEAVVGQPLTAGGVGLLTVLGAPVLLILLAITVLLLPVSLLAFLALVVAAVFGWIAIGLAAGERLAETFNWELHPAAAAGLGTLLLSLVVGGIGQVPCVGWLAPFLVIVLGLGGVVLSRFGTRTYAPGVLAPSVSVEETPED